MNVPALLSAVRARTPVRFAYASVTLLAAAVTAQRPLPRPPAPPGLGLVSAGLRMAVPPPPAPQPAACGRALPPMTPAEQAAQEFERSSRSGQELSRSVQRVVTELAWHKKLDVAAKAATAQGKPIVWVQALGDIRGVT